MAAGPLGAACWRKRGGCHSLAGVTGVRLHPWGAFSMEARGEEGQGHAAVRSRGEGQGGEGPSMEESQGVQQWRQQGHVLVSSTGMDGEVKCWRMSAGGGLQV